MKYTAAEVRKFITATAGAVLIIANELLTAYADILPPEVSRWLTVIVAIGTALGVFGVPNKPAASGNGFRVEDVTGGENFIPPANGPTKNPARRPII